MTVPAHPHQGAGEGAQAPFPRGPLKQPVRGEPIPKVDLYYIRARFSGEMHQMMLRSLTDDVDHNSGESFVAKCRQIAKMTGRRTMQIRAALGTGTSDFELIADILWALDGATLDGRVKYPLNRRAPTSAENAPVAPLPPDARGRGALTKPAHVAQKGSE